MIFICCLINQTAFAQKSGKSSFDFKTTIFEHLEDRYGWEVPFSSTKQIPLPVILFSKNSGWQIFSSARITNGKIYNNFYIAKSGDYKNKIVESVNGGELRPIDISITKNVAALIISALIVFLLIFKVKSWYLNHGMKAPRKFTASIEFLVEFIYGGVIKPTLGEKANRFAPYLLSLFFFIFVMNMMGQIVIFPGGTNLTGNIAVTGVLALSTFIATNLLGKKHYWKDIFWPDMPLWLKFPIPIMPIIEIFGVFTKPAALTVRLFANMLGGHLIALVLTSLIFIFAKYGIAVQSSVTVVSVLFELFMLLLDTLIGFIQAYVFITLSAIFICLAQEEK